MESSGDSNAGYCNQFRPARVGAPNHGHPLIAWHEPGNSFAVVLVLTFCLGFIGVAPAADLPPRPSGYFNDLDSLVKKSTAERLNRELADFDHRTSNQLIVVIYPKLPSGISIGQYGMQLVHAWKLDPRGAILLVDDQNHLLRIEAGRDLKEKLSEVKCKKIFSEVMMPRFKVDDFDGGMQAGVDAVIAAALTK